MNKIKLTAFSIGLCILFARANARSLESFSSSQTALSKTTLEQTVTPMNSTSKVESVSVSSTTYIQNESITGPRTIDSDILKIGSKVTSSKQEGPVKIGSGKVKIQASSITFESGVTISIDANLVINNK